MPLYCQVYIVRRNLEVIEVCSMLPALCSSLRTMVDSRMSLDQALRAVTWVGSAADLVDCLHLMTIGCTGLYREVIPVVP
jgi:hypothetical protein